MPYGTRKCNNNDCNRTCGSRNGKYDDICIDSVGRKQIVMITGVEQMEKVNILLLSLLANLIIIKFLVKQKMKM